MADPRTLNWGPELARALAADDARRHCPRCGADVHAPDPPHLCKDLRERQERQEKAITLIEGILDHYRTGGNREPAEEIYRVMSGRDLP